MVKAREREREKKRLAQAGGQAGVMKWLERCWRKQLAPRQPRFEHAGT